MTGKADLQGYILWNIGINVVKSGDKLTKKSECQAMSNKVKSRIVEKSKSKRFQLQIKVYYSLS